MLFEHVYFHIVLSDVEEWWRSDGSMQAIMIFVSSVKREIGRWSKDLAVDIFIETLYLTMVWKYIKVGYVADV